MYIFHEKECCSKCFLGLKTSLIWRDTILLKKHLKFLGKFWDEQNNVILNSTSYSLPLWLLEDNYRTIDDFIRRKPNNLKANKTKFHHIPRWGEKKALKVKPSEFSCIWKTSNFLIPFLKPQVHLHSKFRIQLNVYILNKFASWLSLMTSWLPLNS